MKTDTKRIKLRARRMWANCYPEVMCVHASRKSAMAGGDTSYPRAFPVAVIPLHDLTTLGDSMVSALTSLGVVPKRKGGRK